MRPFANAMHWLAQPHSGWTSSSASGASLVQRSMSAGRMPGVDVALAHPDRQLAARSRARARCRGTCPAGTGSRGRPGSPRSPPSRCPRCSSSRSRPSPRRSCSRTRRRRRRGARPSTSRSWSAVIEAASEQPASRSGISTVFSGAEDRRRLGHEVDAAEDDRLGVGRGRLAARGRASRRRSRRRPAPRAPGSCGRGSPRRARAASARTSSCRVGDLGDRHVTAPPGRRRASGPSGSARRRR